MSFGLSPVVKEEKYFSLVIHKVEIFKAISTPVRDLGRQRVGFLIPFHCKVRAPLNYMFKK